LGIRAGFGWAALAVMQSMTFTDGEGNQIGLGSAC